MPLAAPRSAANHTDHQHGRVLAGSVNIDMIAAAAPNSLNQLRVQSEGYDLCVIDLDDPDRPQGGGETTASLLRGRSAWRKAPVWTYISSKCPGAAAFLPLPHLRCWS